MYTVLLEFIYYKLHVQLLLYILTSIVWIIKIVFSVSIRRRVLASPPLPPESKQEY